MKGYIMSSDTRWTLGFLIIVGICVAAFLLAPMFCYNIKQPAPRTVCHHNMKNIALALLAYQNSHSTLPPAYTVDESGKPLHSWRVLILPMLSEEKLYKEIRLDEPWDSEHNRQFHTQMPRVFRCPAGKSPGHGLCYYSVVVGEETLFTGSQGVNKDQITDNPAATILLVERKTPVCWMDPTQEITFADLSGLGSGHSANITAFADGTVCAIPQNIAPETLRALLTKADGERVNVDDL